jgi:hypothetical protein
VASGVGGKPTVQFASVNVQILNGAGSTASVNGTGNLVLGYDETPGSQTGSHNLVLGQVQAFTSYGDVVGGYANTVSGAYSAALGYFNTVSGIYSFGFGDSNTVSGELASILGGYKNTASAELDTVLGGCSNIAGSGVISISSSCTNTAHFPHSFATVVGGVGNQAAGPDTSVSGGRSSTDRDRHPRSTAKATWCWATTRHPARKPAHTT